MSSQPEFQVFECNNPACQMRFSTDLSINHFDNCPACSSEMHKVGQPYKNSQPSSSPGGRIRLSLLLDNLRSTLNVGSIFRSAEGAGVEHVYCCGITPTPEHPKIKKSSLGAESITPWSQHANAFNLITVLQSQGRKILALESTPGSLPLFNFTFSATYDEVVLVLGNEISGVDPGILKDADQVLEIPMNGVKTSLNVAVSAGIAVYYLLHLADASSDQKTV